MDEMNDTRAVLQRHITAWNERAPERDPWGDQAEMVAPGGVRLAGRDSILAFERGFWTAFPDARLEIVRMVTEGGRAAGEGRLTGTHRGTLQTASGPVAATGRRIELRWLAMYQVAADELVSEHLFFDQLELLAQLGLDRS